jgi:membrane fusion protein, multidrug efflux system
MNSKHVALYLLVIVALFASACSQTGEGNDGKKSIGRPPVAVEVAAATPATLTQSIDVVGTLEPKYFAEIKSEFTALVDEVYVTQWVKVQKGTPLAKLDTKEADAMLRATKAAVLQADVAEKRAQRELDRAIKLKEFGLVTQQMLDDARSGQEAATAGAQAAHAELAAAEARYAKTIIRSPMAGIVAMRGVNVGDRVENMGGDPMFRIVDTNVLELVVQIPSAQSAAIQVGQELQFAVDALPGRTFTGKVMHINPTSDPVSRAVKIMADVPNTSGELRGGMFVKGRIRLGERSNVLQIPRLALVSWDAEKRTGEVLLFAGEAAERRSVTTGELSGDVVEITGGLVAGDKVITRGAFNIRPGDRVQLTAPQGA